MYKIIVEMDRIVRETWEVQLEESTDPDTALDLVYDAFYDYPDSDGIKLYSRRKTAEDTLEVTDVTVAFEREENVGDTVFQDD